MEYCAQSLASHNKKKKAILDEEMWRAERRILSVRRYRSNVQSVHMCKQYVGKINHCRLLGADACKRVTITSFRACTITMPQALSLVGCRHRQKWKMPRLLPFLRRTENHCSIFFIAHIDFVRLLERLKCFSLNVLCVFYCVRWKFVRAEKDTRKKWSKTEHRPTHTRLYDNLFSWKSEAAINL